jgi:uncharacterized protein YodC (DUF2158 family)
MSTTPDTRYDDATLQAAVDAACGKISGEFKQADGALFIASSLTRRGWTNEAPARLALARALLERLPEPTPPVVDGKTPAQILFGVFNNDMEWEDASDEYQKECVDAASAVLAAFGQSDLQAAIARMEAVPVEALNKTYWGAGEAVVSSWGCDRVRARLISAVRKGQPADSQELYHNAMDELRGKREALNHLRTQHNQALDALTSFVILWQKWPNVSAHQMQEASKMAKAILGECSPPRFYEPEGQPAAVDWKAKYEAEHDTSLMHMGQLQAARERAEKAEAELASLTTWKAQAEAIADVISRTHPQLRPISSAGPVPEGCVRVTGYIDGNGKANLGTTKRAGNTHFADIRLPTTAVEAEPTQAEYHMPKIPNPLQQGDTFTTHGKEWTEHTPGDPMPCDGKTLVTCLLEGGNSFGRTAKASELCWSMHAQGSDIVGWRYADEPTQEQKLAEAMKRPEVADMMKPPAPPWQPAVGDVVQLKSGGPAMTASAVREKDGAYYCGWFTPAGEVKATYFDTACLQPSKEEQP